MNGAISLPETQSLPCWVAKYLIKISGKKKNDQWLEAQNEN